MTDSSPSPNYNTNDNGVISGMPEAQRPNFAALDGQSSSIDQATDGNWMSEHGLQKTGDDSYSLAPLPPQQDQAAPDDDWQQRLPEKFRAGTKDESMARMAQSYQELEQRLSQQGAELQSLRNPPKPPATPETPQELFGKAIGDVFEDAGLDWRGMHDRYHKYGTLESSDYAALNEAGVSPNFMNNALAGQRSQLANEARQAELAKQQQQPPPVRLSPQQEDALVKQVGGEETFRRMSQWGNQTLGPERMGGIEAALQSGNFYMASAAIQGLHSAFMNAMGQEGRMVTMRGPGDDMSPITTQEQFNKVTDDPRWRKDPAWRQRQMTQRRWQM